MDDLNTVTPIIPPMKSPPGLKEYYCPHCNKFLFKGHVNRLKMVCQHCRKMICADEKELFKTDPNKISEEHRREH